MPALSPDSARRITLVSVTGLADASGAGRALAFSQRQLPGCGALLCSPQRPPDLAPGIAHRPIAPLNYHEYGWFMLFALWRVVATEFALVVQEDGWVLDGANWRDAYFDYDYVGAPIHLARIDTPEGTHWRRGFAWSTPEHPFGQGATPVQNGGFSLRSQRLMRALVEHPHIRVEVPPPDGVGGEPLQMHWQHDALLEDVQLTGVLRPALEAVGLRFAPVEVARSFAIEHAGLFHHGYDALQLFGHHSKLRRLAAIDPPTLRHLLPRSQIGQIYGEPELLQLFERRGYAVEFAPEPVAEGVARRRVFDACLYNGEADVLAARLHELADVVDVFVVVEATRTFSGLPKTTRFDPSEPRIAAFLPRIRHVVVEDMPVDGDAWGRERFQRNAVLRGLRDMAQDDLVLLSDVDEIPRAAVVRDIAVDQHHDAWGFGLAMYYFYANYRNVQGPEAMTVWSVAATGGCLATTTPDQLRYDVRGGRRPARLIAEAGWHLSFLMDVQSVRRKIAAFSHQEYNTEDFLAAIDIDALVARGGDMFGRAGFVWQVVSPDEAPAWLYAQPALRHLFIGAGPAPAH